MVARRHPFVRIFGPEYLSILPRTHPPPPLPIELLLLLLMLARECTAEKKKTKDRYTHPTILYFRFNIARTHCYFSSDSCSSNDQNGSWRRWNHGLGEHSLYVFICGRSIRPRICNAIQEKSKRRRRQSMNWEPYGLIRTIFNPLTHKPRHIRIEYTTQYARRSTFYLSHTHA